MKKLLMLSMAAASSIALAMFIWFLSDNWSFLQVESLSDVVQFGYDGAEPNVCEEVEIDALLSYEPPYGETASTYFRDAYRVKNGGKKDVVYHAVLYAFDRCYDYISLPAGDLDGDQVFKNARYAVFDQPLLEENFPLDIVEVQYTYGEEELSFYELKLPSNDVKHKDKKLEALARAREIVAEQSGNGTEETARNLYDWLVRNVRYIEAAGYNEREPHYLYDALIEGKSNCDGIANAYALLCNLAGVECFNVSGVPNEEGIGHTWNIVKLNGEYYQLDVTAETGFFEVTGENRYLHFARSAKALANDDYEKICAEFAPLCLNTDRDNADVDLIFETQILTNDELEQVDAAIARLEQGEKDIVLWCGPMAKSDWEQNFEVIGNWFRTCAVDVRLVSSGKCYCIIYHD